MSEQNVNTTNNTSTILLKNGNKMEKVVLPNTFTITEICAYERQIADMFGHPNSVVTFMRDGYVIPGVMYLQANETYDIIFTSSGIINDVDLYPNDLKKSLQQYYSKIKPTCNKTFKKVKNEPSLAIQFKKMYLKR